MLLCDSKRRSLCLASSDGAFLPADAGCRRRRDAEAAGSGDGEEQHGVAQEEQGRDRNLAEEQREVKRNKDPLLPAENKMIFQVLLSG